MSDPLLKVGLLLPCQYLNGQRLTQLDRASRTPLFLQIILKSAVITPEQPIQSYVS